MKRIYIFGMLVAVVSLFLFTWGLAADSSPAERDSQPRKATAVDTKSAQPISPVQNQNMTKASGKGIPKPAESSVTDTNATPVTRALLAGEQTKWLVISSGGNRSTSASYVMTTTAGQTAIGLISSAGYRINQGFWPGIPYVIPCMSAPPPDVPVNPIPSNGALVPRNVFIQWTQPGDTLLWANFEDKPQLQPIGTGGPSVHEPIAVSSGVVTKVQGAVSQAGRNNLWVFDNPTTGDLANIRWEWLGAQGYTDGVVYVSFEVMPRSLGHYRFEVTAPDLERFGDFELLDDGIIWANNKNGHVTTEPVGFYNLYSKLSFFFRFDLTNQSWYAWINGRPVVTDIAFSVVNPSLRFLKLNIESSDGAYHVDNILVTREASCPTKYDVFGDEVYPPAHKIAEDLKGPLMDLGLQPSNKVVYWRVDAQRSALTTPGPIWAFRTEPTEVDGYEVGDEWVANYSIPWLPTATCGGGDIPNTEDDARDFSKGLEHIFWDWRFDKGNWDARAAHFGIDNDIWFDQVDFMYFSGHGNRGFYFSNPAGNPDDDCGVTPEDCYTRWGDQDIEWFALTACQTIPHATTAQRWAGCLNGLHLMCGSVTNLLDLNYGKSMARYLRRPYRVCSAFYWAIRKGYGKKRGWSVSYLADDAHFMKERIWGYSPVYPDPQPLGNFYWATFTRGSGSPRVPISHGSDDAVTISLPNQRGPVVVTSQKYASQPAGADSLPTVSVIPRTVDVAYVSQIAQYFCDRVGAFCGCPVNRDDTAGVFTVNDEPHFLTVYMGSGGWEYCNEDELLMPKDSQQTLPPVLATVDSMKSLLAGAGFLPGDIGFDTVAVAHLVALDRNTNVEDPDSSQDLGIFPMINRRVAGYPVTGGGSVIDAAYGQNYSLQAVGHGGWRPVSVGAKTPVISLQDALNAIAASGSDITIGGIPIIDTFLVTNAQLGYYEPYADTSIDHLEKVWLIDGHVVFHGDTSEFEIIVPANHQPPRGQILHPNISDAVYSLYDTIPALGAATGGRAPYTYTWYSDRDGYLGTGSSLPISGLSHDAPEAGITWHSLELHVVDSDSTSDRTWRRVGISTTCLPCAFSTALGAAVIQDTLGLMKITNVGGSGNDGVSIFGDPDTAISGYVLPVPLTSPGQEIKFKFYGQASAAGSHRAPAETYLAGFGMTNTGGTIQITGDFTPIGDPNVQIAVYNGSTLVGSTIVPGGGVIAIAASSGNGVPQVNRFVSVSGAIPVMEVGLDCVGLITATNSVSLTGNRIRLISLASSQTITGLSRVDITGKFTGFSVTNTSVSRGTTCCRGFTGNVDFDPTDIADIADLSTLIDYLYISFTPLLCPGEANVDGSTDGNVDISDLSALIDYLYISFSPPSVCK